MPLVRVTMVEGSLNEDQRAQLADEMTGVLLLIEGGVDNPQGRSIAYVIFEEIAAKDWYVGGKVDDTYVYAGGRFIFNVTVPQGSCNQDRKNAVHKAVNDALFKVLGVAPEGRAGSSAWVLINEVPEGHWGAMGRMVGIRRISQLAQMSPDRAEYFEPLLAALKRMHEANGYPAGAGSY
jgi:phenylpyruvate tautomerase PptA (4-oxalocrotonate tautomerase family)